MKRIWILTHKSSGKLLLATQSAAVVATSPLPAVAQQFDSGNTGQFGFLLAIGAFAAGIALGGAVVCWWMRNRDALKSAVASVPRPRQLVSRNGKVIYSNPAFYEVFGGAEEAIPDLLAKESGGDEGTLQQLSRLKTQAEHGQSGQAEIRVVPRVAPDGREEGEEQQEEWRHVAAYPILGRPGFVFWVVDDITPRRQMEQVIREEQERFVDLLEHAPIGFYSVNAEGRFLFMNGTLQEWLNLTQDDVEKDRVRLHDVLAPPPDAPAYHPFADPDASYGDVVLNDGDGGSFRASITQDLVTGDSEDDLRTRSVVRDLSREQAMAAALERSEARFGRLFQEAPVGVTLIDSEGKITECNAAFCKLVGKDETDLQDQPLLELIVEDKRANAQAAFERRERRVTESGARAPIGIGLGPNGETICSMYVTRMDDPEGGEGGYIAQFIDTTEQKNLEVQFTQSQKMQAVGQLAGGIAHDFNNLLTAMIGFSDLLLLRHRPGDQSFADIMQIKQNANRAANLVRQLLAFSRQQTLQPKPLNVTDILAELSHLLRRLIGENIELSMRHGRDLGVVKADQGQLEQVIINLVVNARDAMPEGGELSIVTENVTVEKQRKVRGEEMPVGDYVLVEVSDKGCGISRENLDRIFDPFFSTKEVGAGTGLGLSTVYGIVKQSGGYVFVDSTEGTGTTFSIYLPQIAETEVQAAEAAERTQESRDLTGMGTLMLVEDEDGVRTFSARALRNKGYNVLEANSGDTALDMFKDGAKDVDLLITDVVMPRVDGPTLVKEIRGSHPDLKVIFISGYTEDAFRKRVGEEPEIHFLQKPFSLKQLAGKVKEVLEA